MASHNEERHALARHGGATASVGTRIAVAGIQDRSEPLVAERLLA